MTENKNIPQILGFNTVQWFVLIMFLVVFSFLAGLVFNPYQCVNRCNILTEQLWKESIALQRVCPCECVGWC